MSVKATNVPLKELLSEMQKKSGIVVELKDTKAAERPFSIDLKSVLPTRAFEEVLRDLNYAFLYSENRLSQVLILPPGVEISQRQAEKGPQPTMMPPPGAAPAPPALAPYKIGDEKERERDCRPVVLKMLRREADRFMLVKAHAAVLLRPHRERVVLAVGGDVR